MSDRTPHNTETARPYCLRCEVPICLDENGVWRREATGVDRCPRNPAGDGHEPREPVLSAGEEPCVTTATAEVEPHAETDEVRVGFRYRDGEVLSPEREAQSEDVEIPVAVIDLGDGEWLTLAELRDMHAERLEQTLMSGEA